MILIATPVQQPAPDTNKARIIFYKGDGASRAFTKEEMVFELGSDGKPATYKFKEDLRRLLRSNGEAAVSVELAIPGVADATATTRLEALRTELATLRPGITSKGVRATTATEQKFIATPSKVDELLVIRVF
jgi:hypothetical protein